MKERIARITERWFLSEEPLFSAFCTHRVAENREMACYARVGKGVIEVNPDLCKDISDKELMECLAGTREAASSETEKKLRLRGRRRRRK